MAISNAKLTENAAVIDMFPPATPSSAAPKWVSLKNFERASIVIIAANGSGVTGSAVALSQATTVTGTSAKTLGFSTVDADTDTGSSDAFTATAVASNTFTTDATNSKNLKYVIEVKNTDLDVANGFDCFRVTLGNAVNTTVSAVAILREPRYADATEPTAVAN